MLFKLNQNKMCVSYFVPALLKKATINQFIKLKFENNLN